jgi:hypothetical protein
MKNKPKAKGLRGVAQVLECLPRIARPRVQSPVPPKEKESKMGRDREREMEPERP